MNFLNRVKLASWRMPEYLIKGFGYLKTYHPRPGNAGPASAWSLQWWNLWTWWVRMRCGAKVPVCRDEDLTEEKGQALLDLKGQ